MSIWLLGRQFCSLHLLKQWHQTVKIQQVAMKHVNINIRRRLLWHQLAHYSCQSFVLSTLIAILDTFEHIGTLSLRCIVSSGLLFISTKMFKKFSYKNDQRKTDHDKILEECSECMKEIPEARKNYILKMTKKLVESDTAPNTYSTIL